MLGLLASAGKNLLSTILPSAVNWGVNKLMTTNFGKSVLSRPLMDKISSGISMVKQAIPQPPVVQQKMYEEVQPLAQVQSEWEQRPPLPPPRMMKKKYINKRRR